MNENNNNNMMKRQRRTTSTTTTTTTSTTSYSTTITYRSSNNNNMMTTAPILSLLFIILLLSSLSLLIDCQMILYANSFIISPKYKYKYNNNNNNDNKNLYLLSTRSISSFPIGRKHIIDITTKTKMKMKTTTTTSSTTTTKLFSTTAETTTNDGSSSNNNNINNNEGIGVGIDLGTTNSAIAYLDDTNIPKIVEIPNNGRTMKSVVGPIFLSSAGDDENTKTTTTTTTAAAALVGNDAIDWECTNNNSAYRHFKRVIGTGTTFLSNEIVDVVPHVIKNNNMVNNDLLSSKNKNNKKKSKKKKKKNKPPSLIRLLEDVKANPTMLEGLVEKTDHVSPELVSSEILSKLIEVARKETQQHITRAVIGVPAYFNDAQRDATIRSANLAGIDKVKLLREPEAAALAYGIDDSKKGSSGEEEELVLVFDLGGGTYDVSILLVEKGLTEIVCTSGNAKLGGSNFDYKIAKHLQSITKGCGKKSDLAFDKMIRAAESIRIYLSNNRVSNLALPITDDGWITMDDPSSVIIMKDNNDDDNISVDDRSKKNEDPTNHILYELTRKEMEKICIDELQQLLRPIREVCVMAGALLQGDASPTIVESAIAMESIYTTSSSSSGGEAEEEQEVLENFYNDDDKIDTISSEIDFRQAKKMQQKGRKKAREVAKKERKYRDESRKAAEKAAQKQQQTSSSTKVQAQGISGRPISRVVLVGGATRMPAIGRIISALTGVVPQKTVDPDEAVALGCAVHVGVLDGKEEMGTVLNPMQAALLRAVVEKQKRDGMLDGMIYDDDDDKFFDDEEEFGFSEEIIF